MRKNTLTCAAVMTVSLALDAATAQAGDAPVGNIASPKVYKLIAESPEWRVQEGTWKPGQEDHIHSDPGDRDSIFPMNCELRLINRDGTYKDVHPKAGQAKVRTGLPDMRTRQKYWEKDLQAHDLGVKKVTGHFEAVRYFVSAPILANYLDRYRY